MNHLFRKFNCMQADSVSSIQKYVNCDLPNANALTTALYALACVSAVQLHRSTYNDLLEVHARYIQSPDSNVDSRKRNNCECPPLYLFRYY